ncbi:MAG: CheB methylesterase domain-containing protein, partial [Candidatus Halalkalibacterium sp. M3_1C_030]
IPILRMASRLQNQAEVPKTKYNRQAEHTEADRVSLSDLKIYRPRIMVIGACTGGPKALTNLIEGLPENLNIPVVIVQHFPKYFTAELADMLDMRSKLKVREAYEGAPLKAGTVYIAPGGYHSEISGWSCKPVLKVHRGPRELNDRPSINNLFRSASNIFGRNVLAVILSGHGEDGLEGVKAVKRAGGLVIVQHPDSAIVPDLPLMILDSGFGDFKFFTEQLTDALRKINKEDNAPSKSSGNRKSGIGSSVKNELYQEKLSYY